VSDSFRLSNCVQVLLHCVCQKSKKCATVRATTGNSVNSEYLDITKKVTDK